MKKYFSGLVTGIALTLLVGNLVVGALAISGRMTIEVDPVNLRVNGEVFAPADANGAPVPVFAYNGTTYAPVRALAEAYGLEVGYDAATNMATVVDPEAKPITTPAPDTAASISDYSNWSAEDEAAYQEWKSQWVIEQEYSGYNTFFEINAESYECIFNGTLTEAEAAVAYGEEHGFFDRLKDDCREQYEPITFSLYYMSDKGKCHFRLYWINPEELR